MSTTTQSQSFALLTEGIFSLREIGQGSHGKVYAGELTAHKFVKRGECFWDDDSREIKICKEILNQQNEGVKLSHYIVKILAVTVGNEGFFISMERAECSLFGFIISKEYKASGTVISSLFQLQNALVFMHLNGWLHRDIKPGNILRCHSNHGTVWKLCDFGKSRPFGSDIGINDCTPQCQTTYLYAPPGLLEQKKRPTLGVEADYYALGATILHALFPERFYLEEETEKCGLQFALTVVPELLKKAALRMLPDEMDLMWAWMSLQE